MTTGSGSWQEYYTEHKSRYRRVFRDRLALGEVSFGQQLHHTAIQDASGTVAGCLPWCAYSQPSAETLLAFLPIFDELLTREPHRIRSSRYLFLVTAGPTLSTEEVRTALVRNGALLDLWSASLLDLDQIQNLDALLALGVQAMFGADSMTPTEEAVDLSRADVGSLRNLRDRLRDISSSNLSSVVPEQLRIPLADSTVVLMAQRSGLHLDLLVEALRETATVALMLAAERSRESGLGDNSDLYCQQGIERTAHLSVEYVVQPGDTLTRIVRRTYEMPFVRLWPIIRVLNPTIMDPDKIRAGQRIHLPKLA